MSFYFYEIRLHYCSLFHYSKDTFDFPNFLLESVYFMFGMGVSLREDRGSKLKAKGEKDVVFRRIYIRYWVGFEMINYEEYIAIFV